MSRKSGISEIFIFRKIERGKGMKVLFTGGGTAGHINPAIAVADFIKREDPNAQILYVGRNNSLEEKLARKAGLDFEGITVSGLSRSMNLDGFIKNVKTAVNVVKALNQSKTILRKFKPDICIGTGGYTSGPVLWKAGKFGIPFIIHEQNALPGLTTKILAKKARKVMVCYEGAKEHLKSASVELTGNPVRSQIGAISKEEAKKILGFDSRPVIFSFGGSLGARKINEAVAELIYFSLKKQKFNHIHGYGRNGSKFRSLLEKKGINLKTKGLIIQEYIDDMGLKLAAADLVICRAGATSLSEIAFMGKPAILIPSPNVTENHQFHNASELSKIGAASMIEESELTGRTLVAEVNRIFSDENILKSYSENVKKTAKTDACKKIFSIISDTISKKES